MSIPLGMNAKLYLANAPLDGPDPEDVEAATWSEYGNARDVTINLETATADVTTRANNGWRQTVGTLKDGTIEFEALWQTGDALFELIKDAFLQNTEIGVMALDGARTVDGSQGIAGNFSVTSFVKSEALEEAQSVSVTLSPSSQTQWYEKITST